MTAEAYFSVDVEADGPIPGRYSMSSIGIVVAGVRATDGTLIRLGTQPYYYAELRPISTDFIAEAAAVSGLDRADLIAKGKDPVEEMTILAEWIDHTCTDLTQDLPEQVRPVFAAYPLGYDWMFTYWYLMNFARRSPFGHSAHIDMKSLFATKASRGILTATKSNMPGHLLSDRPHTHNALDDAREQGDLLMNLIDWSGDSAIRDPVTDDLRRPKRKHG